MPALPPASDATGATVTEGQFKTWLTNVRAYLADLFGTDGTIATALASLGVLFGAGTPAVSTTTSITAADRGKVYRASGTIALNLPTAAAAGAGWAIAVQNGGTGVVTLDGASAETVDGSATVAIPRGRTVIVWCNGTGWETAAMHGTGGGPVLMDAGAAATPGLAVAGDENTGIYSPGADQIGLTTGGVLRLSASTTAITASLQVQAQAGSLSAPAYSFIAEPTSGFYRSGLNNLSLGINNVEVARWNGNGMGVGTAPSVALHVAGETDARTQITNQRASDNVLGPRLFFRKSRGTVGAPTAALLNDRAALVQFDAWDGSTFGALGSIIAALDANASAGSTQGRVVISTSPSGSSTPVERLRVHTPGISVTGRIDINGMAFGGTSVVIANNAVAIVTPPRTGGTLHLSCGGQTATPNEGASATISFDVGTTPATEKSTGFSARGALVDVSLADLTITPGTNGRVTVSARSDGTLQINNRIGSSQTFDVMVTP